MQYVLKAFDPEAMAPTLQTVAVTRDADALDLGRGLLRGRAAVRQVEIWRDERRIATVERVV